MFLAAAMTSTPPDQHIESSSRAWMMIDPKARSADFYQVFEILRKDRANTKITFLLADGSSITNVSDLQLMTGGTLLLFKIAANQGMQYQVIAVEQITGIQVSP